MANEYDAFISYSHGGDGKLAPAVQRGLARLAKPWNRRQALRVFRDDTGLAVSPHLWTSIVEALDGARYFVLFASPEAAASEWVNREIAHWRAAHGVSSILPILTDGEWVWDPKKVDFDMEKSTAVPAALVGAFNDEPRHLDLRWARSEKTLTLRDTRFRAAIADLAAPMHGIPKEDLESEDLHQQRKTLRLARGAVVLLALLTVGALVGAGLAVANANRAERERKAAVARELAATSSDLSGEDIPASLVLAAAAQRIDAGPAARRALLKAALAGPQMERSIRRSGTVVAAGDGSAFVIVDSKERNRITIYGAGGRVQQLIKAPRVGLVYDAWWVQGAGPASRPTGLVIVGTTGAGLARRGVTASSFDDATLLSSADPKEPLNVSDDGTRVAVEPRRGEVRIFSIDPNPHQVYRGTFSPAKDPSEDGVLYSLGAKAVVVNTQAGFSVIDTRTGDLITEWENPGGRYTVADDGTLTFAAESGLFSVPSGTRTSRTTSSIPLATRSPVQIPIGGITISDLTENSNLATRPDGNEVALATAKEVVVSDVAAGTVLWRVQEPALAADATASSQARSVFFVPGSSLLLDDSAAGSVLRDVATGAIVWQSLGAKDMKISPSGRRAIFAAGDTTAIVDLTTAKVIAQEPVFSDSAVWSSDETAVLTFGNQPRLWQITPSGVTSSRAGLQGAPASADAVFPAGGARLITSARGRVTVWHLGSDGIVGSQKHYGVRFQDLDPVSGVVALVDPDTPNTVQFVGPTGKHLGRYRTHGKPSSVRVLHGGDQAVVEETAGDTTSVAVVDVASGRAATHGGKICGFDSYGPLVPSPTSRWYVGLSLPKTDAKGSKKKPAASLVACDPSSGRTRRMRAPDGVLTSYVDEPGVVGDHDLAISDDGRWVVYTTNDYVTRLVDLTRERVVRHWSVGHLPQVVLSRDGARVWLLDGSDLQAIDRDSGARRVVSIPLDETVWRTNFAIDDDERLAAAELYIGDESDPNGRTEVVTVLIDLAAEHALGTISDRIEYPTGEFGFSTGGSKFVRVLSDATDSYTVLTWNVSTDALARIACDRSGGNLTQAEWNALVPDADFTEPCPRSATG